MLRRVLLRRYVPHRPLVGSMLRSVSLSNVPKEAQESVEAVRSILHTAVGGHGKEEEEGGDGQGVEELVVRSSNRTRFLWGGMLLSTPLLYSGAVAASRLLWGKTAAETHSWPLISVLMFGSLALLMLNARMARFHIREAWYVRGGTHVRLRTFRFPWGYGPSVTIPAHLLEEANPDRPDKFRYLQIQNVSGPLMALAKDAEVLRPDLLEDLCAGKPADLTAPERPVHWRKTLDPNGKPYYYHTVTQETSWEPPKGWVDVEEGGEEGKGEVGKE